MPFATGRASQRRMAEYSFAEPNLARTSRFSKPFFGLRRPRPALGHGPATTTRGRPARSRRWLACVKLEPGRAKMPDTASAWLGADLDQQPAPPGEDRCGRRRQCGDRRRAHPRRRRARGADRSGDLGGETGDLGRREIRRVGRRSDRRPAVDAVEPIAGDESARGPRRRGVRHWRAASARAPRAESVPSPCARGSSASSVTRMQPVPVPRSSRLSGRSRQPRRVDESERRLDQGLGVGARVERAGSMRKLRP